MGEYDHNADLEDALYGDDPVLRDSARRRLAERATHRAIEELILLMDARQRSTRRRAARILSEVHPARMRAQLQRALADTDRPERLRRGAARVLSVTTHEEESVLAAGLQDPSARVRRACATTAAPAEALFRALEDPVEEVVDRVALSIELRALTPPTEALSSIQETHRKLPSVLRLLARCAPGSEGLHQAARDGHDTALDHLQSPEVWQELLETQPAAASWGLARADRSVDTLAEHQDARVRQAVARTLSPGDSRLDTLAEDSDPGVQWMAQRSRGGAFDEATMKARIAPHAWLDAPSTKPPYGLKSTDAFPDVQRVHAALALCHTSFDINLGVSIRSADAAGLREVFIMGRGDVFRSPARGSDLTLPVRHAIDVQALIRMAREGDYQIVAIQQTPDSVPFHRADYPPRPLFVMGAEDDGLPNALRQAADLVVEIPLFGVIDSLNVAATATTVIFHWRCSLGD